MADKSHSRTAANAEQRRIRNQRLVMNILGIIVILSWIISLIAH